MKIAISAGEESGDILGSDLIDSLRDYKNDIEFIGLGGEKMKEKGLKPLFPFEEISKMGLIEPLFSLKNLLRRRKQLIDYIIDEQPDVFIGVDSPSFNLGISKRLKLKTKIKTIQYVCPQIWAWRKKRIRKFSNYLDHIFCLYKFETKILKNHNLESSFVGHPLAKKIELEINKEKYKDHLNLDRSKTHVALLPGSRDSEIKKHTDDLLSMVSHYKNHNPKIKFILALTKNSRKYCFEEKMKELDNLSIFYDDTKNVLSASDFSIIASGTATLEAALCKTPMFVIYKTNFLSYFILSRLIYSKFISLPNILSEKKIVKELLQSQVNFNNLVYELDILMNEDNKEMKLNFENLHRSLINDNRSKFFSVIESI